MKQNPFDQALMAAIYDEDNPDGPDHDFYRALAQELNAKTIVDLGCGTGILTVTLAGADRKVIGVDPASAMLDVARAREGGGNVQWVQGYSSQIKPNSADLVVMTGNVAMHILAQAWKQTLSDIAQGLKPGGVLAFETRSPDARAWEKWNMAGKERMTSAGVLHETTTVSEPDSNGIVTMVEINRFEDTGDVLELESHLQFRSFEVIRQDLENAGLYIDKVYSSWSRDEFVGGANQPLMIVLSRSAAS